MFPRINVFLHMYACICISEWGSFHNAHTNTQTHIQITYKCTYIHTNTRKKTRAPHAKYTRTPNEYACLILYLIL